jgi:hypothetical protein
MEVQSGKPYKIDKRKNLITLKQMDAALKDFEKKMYPCITSPGTADMCSKYALDSHYDVKSWWRSNIKDPTTQHPFGLTPFQAWAIYFSDKLFWFKPSHRKTIFSYGRY